VVQNVVPVSLGLHAATCSCEELFLPRSTAGPMLWAGEASTGSCVPASTRGWPGTEFPGTDFQCEVL